MAAPSSAASPAARRAQLLHRGVNASMWFAQAGDYSPARLRSFTTADDIALMHASIMCGSASMAMNCCATPRQMASMRHSSLSSMRP
jgi:hypothetical protein